MDWERKGGPDFLELCRMLKKKGIHYHADIAGCTPEIPNELKTDVEVHGFLSKANPAQKKILDALYQHTHFFILPTHAECTAVVSWIPEIRNESFDRVSPIIYFQEQPTAV